jgi:sugar phosphate isomerase/epimerase
MNSVRLTDHLAVCSWSLQAGNPSKLVAKLQATGIHRVQLALDPLREFASVWGQAADLLRQSGITLVSGMFGCIGEDYTTLETIRRTGGIAPDATWETNLENIRQTVTLGTTLGLKLITFHAGFLPHDELDPQFSRMVQRLSQVADLFEAAGITLGLETGQETASDLRRLLEVLQRPNVGVNFDPANMILYDKGDPIAALRVLGPWIRQVHIKDATRTQVPGQWGAEVPAGTGEVDWRAFFATLKDLKFGGDFVIEREAGNQRVEDIQAAKITVEQAAA